jgi:hypothetical protein
MVVAPTRPREDLRSFRLATSPAARENPSLVSQPKDCSTSGLFFPNLFEVQFLITFSAFAYSFWYHVIYMLCGFVDRPAGGWAGSTPTKSQQGLETRARKRARTESASSPSADSNGTLGAAIGAQRDTSRVTTDSYQGNTASAYRTWLQGIDPQTTDKPAYTTYIGAKVAQHFETGWGVGVVCCITADPRLRSMTGRPSPHQKSAFLHHLGGQH